MFTKDDMLEYSDFLSSAIKVGTFIEVFYVLVFY